MEVDSKNTACMYMVSLHMCCLSCIWALSRVLWHQWRCVQIKTSKKKKIGTMFSYVLLVIFRFLVPLGIIRQKQRKEVDLGRTVGVLRPRTLAFGHVAHTSYLEIPHMVFCFELFLYLFIFALCFECVFPSHSLHLFIKFGKTAKK